MQLPPLLQSKKFLAALAASLISFFGMREGMTLEQLGLIVGPLMIFVGAQGIADLGKERAKIEGAAKKPTVATLNVADPSRVPTTDAAAMLDALSRAGVRAEIKRIVSEETTQPQKL